RDGRLACRQHLQYLGVRPEGRETLEPSRTPDVRGAGALGRRRGRSVHRRGNARLVRRSEPRTRGHSERRTPSGRQLGRVSAHVAALPVPYRTTAKSPGFLTLHRPGCRHGFPIELDPFLLTRYEMADFAVAARDLGARFIGVCCGGAPHHLRAMAEALRRTVPAAAYST